MKFDKFITSILEYYRVDAHAFYITADGVIHDVYKQSHSDQIEHDFGLEHLPDRKYDNFIASKKIINLLYEYGASTLFVRAPENTLTNSQRRAVQNFCDEKEAKLVFDTGGFSY
jgi:hypothetical protein